MPAALAAYGRLGMLHTDLYFGRRRLVDGAAARLMGRLGRRFEQRASERISPDLVRDHARVALMRQRRDESRTAFWMRKGEAFCTTVVRAGFGDTKVVYAYSSAALELHKEARQRGLRTILDHATGPRAAEMALLMEEERRFPGWALHRAAGDFALSDYAARQRAEHSQADRIVCGSTYVAQMVQAEGVDRERIVVVPLGIGEEFHAGTSPDLRDRRRNGAGLRVLFVGREALQKGIGYLVEAMQLLNSTSSISLRVVGDLGLSETGLRAVRACAEVVGSATRADLNEHYRWADVLVLPTISDTFGLVILEAMARGVPVITTTSSGGPDVIRDGVDGWVVPPRNPDQLAEKLETLATDLALAHQMGVAASQQARRFASSAYGQRLISAIDDVSQ